jgi:hypothetical protein
MQKNRLWQPYLKKQGLMQYRATSPVSYLVRPKRLAVYNFLGFIFLSAYFNNRVQYN